MPGLVHSLVVHKPRDPIPVNRFGIPLHTPPWQLPDCDTCICVNAATSDGSNVPPSDLARLGARLELLSTNVWLKRADSNNINLVPLPRIEAQQYAKWTWLIDGHSETVLPLQECFSLWFRFTHNFNPFVYLQLRVTAGLVALTEQNGPCSTVLLKESFTITTIPECGRMHGVLISPGRIQKEGFLGTSWYYHIRKSLETAAEYGDIAQFERIEKTAMGKFIKLEKRVNHERISMYIQNLKVVVLLERCRYLYYQNMLDEAEERLEKAKKKLLPKLKQNQGCLSARTWYYVAAVHRKKKELGTSTEALKKGRSYIQNLAVGEDTAEVVYNYARDLMQFISNKGMWSLEKVEEIVALFDDSIRQYKVEPLGNGDNKICRCLLNIAQLYVGCPAHTQLWFTRSLPPIELPTRIAEAKRRVKLIENYYMPQLTGHSLCLYWYTIGVIQYRGCDVQASTCSMSTSLTIAIKHKLSCEENIARAFLEFLAETAITIHPSEGSEPRVESTEEFADGEDSYNSGGRPQYTRRGDWGQIRQTWDSDTSLDDVNINSDYSEG